MKREELIEYKADENFGNGLVYSIPEVNQVLDEKDAEIASLKAKLETVNELVKTSKDMYDNAIESLKASHYAEMVDAGMRERRIRRALWLARADKAKDKQEYENVCRLDGWVHRQNKWLEVERKCLKKAELYK